jgi:hypothetical protein
MANKYFYLRSIFETEPMGGLVGVKFREGYKTKEGQYKIGCCSSLSPALLQEKDQVVSTLLGAIGLDYQPDESPPQGSRTAWQIASNPHRRFQDTVPYAEGFVTDTNQPPLDPKDVAERITLAFRTAQDYFSQYDGGAGNNFVLVDFITRDSHRVI